MPRQRRGTARIGYALIAVVIAAAAAITGTYVAQADTNKSSKRLVVYNNNIENMLPKEIEVDGDIIKCDGGSNFDKLITFMSKQKKSPDIFTVQQISNSTELKKLTTKLSDKLPGNYAGRIAIKQPGSMEYNGPCLERKDQQTNAVIYRKDRLSVRDQTTWRSDAPKNPKSGKGKCRNLDPTSPSQDRVENVAVRLYDKKADHNVSVAAIHWPTKKWHGPKCADENLREANRAIERLGGSALKIIAGDSNATTPKQDWWKKARAENYRDPIAEKCGHRVCDERYDTLKKRRIDHILVKSGNGFSHTENISWNMADGKYSHHRALRTYAKY